MKVFAIALVVALGCSGNKQVDLGKWSEVEKAAVPLVQPADGALLAKALDGVTDSDVSEVALAEAIAWRKAGGGLPWKIGIDMADPRPLKAARLGKALLDRRPDDPDAIAAAVYLAHRLRAEGANLLQGFMGFDLAKRAVELGKLPADAKQLAPTEAEVRRALAADAVQFMSMLKDVPKTEQDIVGDKAKRAYIAIVVGAPVERAAFVKHLEGEVAKAQKDDALSIVISPKLPQLVGEMHATIDAYAALAK